MFHAATIITAVFLLRGPSIFAAALSPRLRLALIAHAAASCPAKYFARHLHFTITLMPGYFARYFRLFSGCFAY
jgi:hypothetical protein